MDCWALEDIVVRQTPDGFVMACRKSRDGSKTFLSASPENGKLKVRTGFIQVCLSHLLAVSQSSLFSCQATASRGEQSHMFLRSGEKRLHYTGSTKVLMVRSFGQSAGFDEAGNLRIY